LLSNDCIVIPSQSFTPLFALWYYRMIGKMMTNIIDYLKTVVGLDAMREVVFLYRNPRSQAINTSLWRDMEFFFAKIPSDSLKLIANQYGSPHLVTREGILDGTASYALAVDMQTKGYDPATVLHVISTYNINCGDQRISEIMKKHNIGTPGSAPPLAVIKADVVTLLNGIDNAKLVQVLQLNNIHPPPPVYASDAAIMLVANEVSIESLIQTFNALQLVRQATILTNLARDPEIRRRSQSSSQVSHAPAVACSDDVVSRCTLMPYSSSVSAPSVRASGRSEACPPSAAIVKHVENLFAYMPTFQLNRFEEIHGSPGFSACVALSNGTMSIQYLVDTLRAAWLFRHARYVMAKNDEIPTTVVKELPEKGVILPSQLAPPFWEGLAAVYDSLPKSALNSLASNEDQDVSCGADLANYFRGTKAGHPRFWGSLRDYGHADAQEEIRRLVVNNRVDIDAVATDHQFWHHLKAIFRKLSKTQLQQVCDAQRFYLPASPTIKQLVSGMKQIVPPRTLVVTLDACAMHHVAVAVETLVFRHERISEFWTKFQKIIDRLSTSQRVSYVKDITFGDTNRAGVTMVYSDFAAYIRRNSIPFENTFHFMRNYGLEDLAQRYLRLLFSTPSHIFGGIEFSVERERVREFYVPSTKDAFESHLSSADWRAFASHLKSARTPYVVEDLHALCKWENARLTAEFLGAHFAEINLPVADLLVFLEDRCYTEAAEFVLSLARNRTRSNNYWRALEELIEKGPAAFKAGFYKKLCATYGVKAVSHPHPKHLISLIREHKFSATEIKGYLNKHATPFIAKWFCQHVAFKSELAPKAQDYRFDAVDDFGLPSVPQEIPSFSTLFLSSSPSSSSSSSSSHSLSDDSATTDAGDMTKRNEEEEPEFWNALRRICLQNGIIENLRVFGKFFPEGTPIPMDTETVFSCLKSDRRPYQIVDVLRARNEVELADKLERLLVNRAFFQRLPHLFTRASLGALEISSFTKAFKMPPVAGVDDLVLALNKNRIFPTKILCYLRVSKLDVLANNVDMLMQQDMVAERPFWKELHACVSYVSDDFFDTLCSEFGLDPDESTLVQQFNDLGVLPRQIIDRFNDNGQVNAAIKLLKLLPEFVPSHLSLRLYSPKITRKESEIPLSSLPSVLKDDNTQQAFAPIFDASIEKIFVDRAIVLSDTQRRELAALGFDIDAVSDIVPQDFVDIGFSLFAANKICAALKSLSPIPKK
jgi:hypothetical protein